MSVLPPPSRIQRISVDQYHRMIESGVLTENDNCELIDGVIIDKLPKTPPHATTTTALTSMFTVRSMESGQWHIRLQDPITLANSEPEPDLVVARGKLRDYRTRHPHAADVLLVIEVADSTLKYDQTTKLQVYAEAGIAEYWIVNLVENTVEVYTQPSGPQAEPGYLQKVVYGSGEQIALQLDQVYQVAVDEMVK